MASQAGISIDAAEAKGLIGSLFDFSFHSFLTCKLIRALYALAMSVAALSAFFLIVEGFNLGRGAGIFALFAAPVMFLFSVGCSRVLLELFMVIFRIEEHLSKGR